MIGGLGSTSGLSFGEKPALSVNGLQSGIGFTCGASWSFGSALAAQGNIDADPKGEMSALARRILARYALSSKFLRKFSGKVAYEFSSPEALKEYLHDHPNADKSKHTVKKPEEGKKPAEKKPSEGLFSPEEVGSLGETIGQKTKDADELFQHASEAHQLQLGWLNQGKGLDKTIGAKVIRADKGEEIDLSAPGPIILIGPMKKQDRSKDKVEADFGGDWSRLGDIVRSSIALDTMDDLEKTLDALRKAGLKLARKPKDRFAKPTEGGYRDLMMNVEYPNGHIGELQLHLKPILHAKKEGHHIYDEVRKIEGKAKMEGRDTLTDEEQKAVDAALAKSKQLYADAWTKATGQAKQASLGERVLMRKLAGETKYFDFNGLPAYWEARKFPKKVTPSGDQTIYDLFKFFTEASPISKAEFEVLKEGK